MKDIDELKKIAVLIDAENAQYSKIKAVIDEISAHGHIIVKRAYGDWSKETLKGWKSELNKLAIQPEQQFSYTAGKNSSDARMIIDAMDLLYTNKFDAFALVTSDSDFTSLATRLKQSEIYVFGVGENKTPISFRNACDDFILTENLNKFSSIINETATPTIDTSESLLEGIAKKTTKTKKKVVAPQVSIQEETTSNVSLSRETKEPTDTVDLDLPEENGHSIQQIVELLNKAWEMYHDEDNGYVNVAASGQYIKRLKPDFDARTYGFTKLPELIKSMPEKFEMTRYKGSGKVNIVAYKPKPLPSENK